MKTLLSLLICWLMACGGAPVHPVVARANQIQEELGTLNNQMLAEHTAALQAAYCDRSIMTAEGVARLDAVVDKYQPRLDELKNQLKTEVCPYLPEHKVCKTM